MLGFVSALSASVAVMVLLMSVLLANVLSTTMEMEKNKNKAILEGVKNQSIADNENTISSNITQSLVLNNEIMKELKQDKINTIELSCSYGNNITLDAAMTYTIYNTVLIKRNIPQIVIDAKKPVEDKININTCFFKSKKDEAN
ncbi:hypothetical protein [Providencia rettgeri]|uniref:hypothetical protein n=1 Tax=Providencia rettgeri TaxID=587 RepID=UPI0034E059FC